MTDLEKMIRVLSNWNSWKACEGPLQLFQYREMVLDHVCSCSSKEEQERVYAALREPSESWGFCEPRFWAAAEAAAQNSDRFAEAAEKATIGGWSFGGPETRHFMRASALMKWRTSGDFAPLARILVQTGPRAHDASDFARVTELARHAFLFGAGTE
jgi:hypothetical protein